MADDVTLRFRLTGEDAGAGRALDDAEERVSRVRKTLAGLGAAGAAGGAAAGALLAKGFSDNLDIGEANAKLDAQLGLTAEEAKKAGGVAAAAFAGDWGESMGDVNNALKAVSQNMADVGSTSEADLQGMTEKALALAKVYDVDVNESTRAAGALMKNGLAKDATEAFDIITAGMRDGADKSGDFLDTLNEYSPQFSKLGITGTQALALIEDGLKGGARDADAVADAFKEFSIRAIDGSKTTAAGFQAIGLDAGKAAAEIGKGGPAANAMTSEVLTRLMAMKDPVAQNTAGVALFGTQWEDTVRQTLPALAQWGDAQDVVTGSTEEMATAVGDNAKAKIEGMQRSFDLWTQSLAGAPGPIGGVTTGVIAFGAPALAMAGSLGQITAGAAAMSGGLIATKAAALASAAASGVSTAAQWLWNAALTANPIGIVIVAIAALVAGLIYFFTKTETGRAIFQTAMGGIRTAFFWVRDAGGEAIDWLVAKWNQFTGFITGLPGRMRSSASGMWNGFWDGFRGVINKIIWGWNSLRFSFPGFSFAGVNVQGFSVGTPSIPYLKEGGIVTRPTLAVIGDGGPEAVVPLDQGFGGITVHIHNAVVGNEDAVARTVMDAIRRAGGRGYGPGMAFG